jgi:hypothetical protein
MPPTAQQVELFGLPDTQSDRLTALERLVDAGLTAMHQGWMALKMIHDEELWRAKAGSWTEYVQDRWGISRPRSYELIQAAQVIEQLSGNSRHLPESEGVVNELAGLGHAIDRIDAWNEALETTSREHVDRVTGERRPAPTAAEVRAIVQQRSGQDREALRAQIEKDTATVERYSEQLVEMERRDEARRIRAATRSRFLSTLHDVREAAHAICVIEDFQILNETEKREAITVINDLIDLLTTERDRWM